MVCIKVIFLVQVNIEIKKKLRKEKETKITKCEMSIIRKKRLNRKGNINTIYDFI